ncbi:MAG: ribonuclease R [Bacteroidetes bacterium GWF2_33_38]|nr:MAG: ribonuclease R [Bacteroidetes bacterium GWF2_33_38]HBX51494.1 ribonuclease R [Bacteroidales bacterium]
MSKNKNKFMKKGITFNKTSLTENILAIFNNHPTITLNYKQISKRLEVKDDSTKRLISEVLREQAKREILEEVFTGKFKLKAKAGYLEGTIDMTTKGYGFLVSDSVTEDVFISQVNLKQALHGDKVKVYLYARKNGKVEGEVVQIIQRARTTFVGIVEVNRTFAFLVPDHRQMPYDIFIPLDNLKGAKTGQKAIAKINEWPKKAKNPIGEIVDVLGDVGNSDAEMHAILAEFDLPYKYPEEVVAEAEKIPEKITEKEIAKRRDFRNITTFTIDPVDAKDFDDALSLRKLENGNWEVGVHIADVTHYVEEHGIIDKEGYERATSVYLVDRVVPMLPERLSNFICSLRPNEEKLCFSAVFELDEKATVLTEWFGRTIINSDRRYSYEEAQEIIETGKGDFASEMLTLDDLAKKLRAKRFKTGSIAFDREEVKFKLDETGKPLGVFFKVSKDSNKLIEEFMLLANRKVAERIGTKKGDKNPPTFVYRVHDKPNIDKLNAFSTFIKKFGYSRIKTQTNITIARSINELLDEVRGKVEQNVVETLAIRSMAKAIYTTQNIGHYGLAFSHYTHFTSPIRRFPDMMVHRLLALYLEHGNPPSADKYEEMCKHSSEQEQKAANAERASIKYKQVEFMSDKVGQSFNGVISGVTEWGMYVELEGNKCEGLVPLRDMTDDHYIFDEDNYCLYGRHSDKRFQLGDNVKIRIVKANLAKKQLTFMLDNDMI